jgi:hypothetical protein
MGTVSPKKINRPGKDLPAWFTLAAYAPSARFLPAQLLLHLSLRMWVAEELSVGRPAIPGLSVETSPDALNALRLLRNDPTRSIPKAGHLHSLIERWEKAAGQRPGVTSMTARGLVHSLPTTLREGLSLYALRSGAEHDLVDFVSGSAFAEQPWCREPVHEAVANHYRAKHDSQYPRERNGEAAIGRPGRAKKIQDRGLAFVDRSIVAYCAVDLTLHDHDVKESFDRWLEGAREHEREAGLSGEKAEMGGKSVEKYFAQRVLPAFDLHLYELENSKKLKVELIAETLWPEVDLDAALKRHEDTRKIVSEMSDGSSAGLKRLALLRRDAKDKEKPASERTGARRRS